MKPCKLCKEVFYPARTSTKYCANCSGKGFYYKKRDKKIFAKLRYQGKRIPLLQYSKKWYQEHKERILKQHKEKYDKTTRRIK